MIIVNNITIKYSEEFTLNVESLHIQNYDMVALVGANGSGKSTLLKTIAGIIKPDSGSMNCNCESINDVYYQPQSPFLLNSTVYANINMGFGGRKDRLNLKQRKEVISEVANVCELTQLLKKQAKDLSGGEKQRMFFARLMVSERKLLLLDEPFSAMDVEIAEKSEKLLNEYCEKNKSTLLLCTHLPSQAAHVCKRVIIMHNGSIAEDGETSSIFASPQTEWGKKFIAQWRVD